MEAKKFFNALIFILIIFCIVITFSVWFTYKHKTPEETPEINQFDYQHQIDSLKQIKPTIITRIKWLKETDTVYYDGTDTVCVKIIEHKNEIISSLDSLCDVLDLEAKSYSELHYLETKKSKLHIKRFNALSIKMDSTINIYADSLKFERKTLKKERLKTFYYKATTTVAILGGMVLYLKR